MSIASTIPCIKIKISPSPSLNSSKTCSPKPYFTVRSSKAEGPLRRPTAPSLSPPTVSTAPSLSPPPSISPPAPPAKPVDATSVGEVKGVVTLEFQRRMAKELQDYFRQKQFEEADQGPLFGFLGKNEISNGRWAMFGFAIGLLTEYATGSDFVQQLKTLLSNFGVLDLD